MKFSTPAAEKFLRSYQSGVTLIELIVVLALLGTLFTLTTVNITGLVPKANVSTLTDTLVAELKLQQQKAMSGETEGASTAQPFGVHIDSDRYVMYAGSAYSAGNTANMITVVPDTVQLTSTFSSGDILFNRGSGEINGYSASNDTITITDTTTNTQKVIEFNRYGVVVSVN